jgi:hypothetical protein
MFEYKVIPAPRRGKRIKGAKGNGGRFAATMETTLNELGADGWEFVRAETLPVDERHGVMRKKVEEYHNILVFRRAVTIEEDSAEETPTHRPFFVAPPIQPAAPKLGPATEAVEDSDDVEEETAEPALEETESDAEPSEDASEDDDPMDDEPPVTRAHSNEEKTVARS